MDAINPYFINYEKVTKMNLSAMKSFNAFASGDAPLTKQSEPIRLEWLELKLPTDDIDESQLIYTHGDQLINQFSLMVFVKSNKKMIYLEIFT